MLVKKTEIELRVRKPLLGGETEPFRGLGIILLYALAKGIHLANGKARLAIAAFGKRPEKR